MADERTGPAVPSGATERLFVITPANTSVRFRVRKMGMFTVEGAFGDFHGSAKVDLDDPARGEIDVSIAADSIDTGIGLRDWHLKSRQFLHAGRHPAIQFRATAITPEAVAGRFRIGGDLTIRGRTRPVELLARVEQHEGRYEVEMQTVIDQGRFGIPGLPLVVGRRVEVEIEAVLL